MTRAIVTRTNDDEVWAAYTNDGELLPVWARGASGTEAIASLAVNVHPDGIASPPALEDLFVAVLLENDYGYAAHSANRGVIATGPTADAAVELVRLHVPVPQPTGGSSGDKPPKLEKEPLPPF